MTDTAVALPTSGIVTPLAHDGEVPDGEVPPMRFSATKLKTWQECSLQAYYKYTERIQTPDSAAAVFGRILHDALEYYHETGNHIAALDRFKDNWVHPENLGYTIDYYPPNTSWMEYRGLGIEIITDFKKRNKVEMRDVVGAEIEFCVPFGRHQLHGFIDLLELRLNKRGVPLLRIIDYKTGKWEPSKAELALDIQFTIYYYATLQKEFWTGLPGDPQFPGFENGEQIYQELIDVKRRPIWYHLRNQREKDAGPRTQEDFERLYRLCEEVARSEAAGIHVPHIGSPCQLCDFREECKMAIPSSFHVDPDAEDAWGDDVPRT